MLEDPSADAQDLLYLQRKGEGRVHAHDILSPVSVSSGQFVREAS